MHQPSKYIKKVSNIFKQSHNSLNISQHKEQLEPYIIRATQRLIHFIYGDVYSIYPTCSSTLDKTIMFAISLSTYVQWKYQMTMRHRAFDAYTNTYFSSLNETLFHIALECTLARYYQCTQCRHVFPKQNNSLFLYKLLVYL